MTDRAAWAMNPGAFAGWVLRVLREEAPDLRARVVGPDVIALGEGGETQLGLQNLRATALHQELPHGELRRMVVDWARRVRSPAPVPTTWDAARARVRPQLMPAEYRDQAPAPIVNRPFHSGVAAGVVLDGPDGYGFVRLEDVSAWGVAEDEVWREAAANLDEASSGLRAEGSAGPDRWIAIAISDGYDAARILVPGIRAFLAERLGEPFYAGTPNRDFLVAWAADCGARFWGFVGGKLAKDHAERPYPLTPAVSLATRDTVRLAPPRRG